MREVATAIFTCLTLISLGLLSWDSPGLKSFKTGSHSQMKEPVIIHETPLDCDLCKKPWVFILATGRSGSTTVLEMLNSVPGIKMAGENDAAINKLFKFPFFPGVEHPQAYPLEKPYNGAFEHGVVRMKRLRCWVQEYFRLIEGEGYSGPDVKVNGFKTIRLFDLKVVDFLLDVFPCAKLVLNYRKNVEDGKIKWLTPEERKRQKKNLLEVAEVHPERTFLLPLEDFSVQSFNNMIEWLGFSNCTFLNVSHANKNGGYSSDNSARINGSCFMNDM